MSLDPAVMRDAALLIFAIAQLIRAIWPSGLVRSNQSSGASLTPGPLLILNGAP
jgi:hypothetical protein